VNALSDHRVAEFFNETFVCTYLKVGAFQIINGQKVGGNVASYFCLAEGSVLHAIAGQVDATTLLHEARWAVETRKSAKTFGTILGTDKVDMRKYYERVHKAHSERYHTEHKGWWGGDNEHTIPATMPKLATKRAQTHWLLARHTLAKLDTIYPTVWRQILNEQLSALPVERK